MTWKNELSLGDVIAAAVAIAAVLTAMRQLVTSRRDLIRERRADFYLDQLAEIGITLANPTAARASVLVWPRLRMLPGDLELAFLKEWAETKSSEAARESLVQQWREADSPHGADGFPLWANEKCWIELDQARAQILETARRRTWHSGVREWLCQKLRCDGSGSR